MTTPKIMQKGYTLGVRCGATMNVLDRIQKMKADFPGVPRVLHLSLADEYEVFELTRSEIGTLRGVVTTEGPKKALEQLLQVEVRLNAKETKLSAE